MKALKKGEKPMGDVSHTVKQFILETFLPGESPEELTDSTPLVTSGILDSLSTLKLVAFLEETFKIELQATDVDASRLNTISDICHLVNAKRKGA